MTALKKESASETGYQNIEGANENKLIEYCLFKTKTLDASHFSRFHQCKKLLSSGKPLLLRSAPFDIFLRYLEPYFQINFVDHSHHKDIFRLFLSFKNGYFSYQQIYFFFNDQLLITKIDKNITWFNLNHIQRLLHYATPGYLERYYKSNYGILTKKFDRDSFTPFFYYKKIRFAHASKPRFIC